MIGFLLKCHVSSSCFFFIGFFIFYFIVFLIYYFMTWFGLFLINLYGFWQYLVEKITTPFNWHMYCQFFFLSTDCQLNLTWEVDIAGFRIVAFSSGFGHPLQLYVTNISLSLSSSQCSHLSSLSVSFAWNYMHLTCLSSFLYLSF